MRVPGDWIPLEFSFLKLVIRYSSSFFTLALFPREVGTSGFLFWQVVLLCISLFLQLETMVCLMTHDSDGFKKSCWLFSFFSFYLLFEWSGDIQSFIYHTGNSNHLKVFKTPCNILLPSDICLFCEWPSVYIQSTYSKSNKKERKKWLGP